MASRTVQPRTDTRATRRELVVGTLGAVGAATGLAATGLAAAGSVPAAADIPPQTEPEVLAKALLVERLMVLAYRLVLGSGTVAGSVATTLRGFLSHELEHSSAIAARLAAIGLVAPSGPLEPAAAEALLAKYHVKGSLVQLPKTQRDCLVMLVDLESVGEGTYFTGLRDLHDPDLIRLSAQIMSCEAQHWTVLMELLNPYQVVKAVPWPFVLGTS